MLERPKRRIYHHYLGASQTFPWTIILQILAVIRSIGALHRSLFSRFIGLFVWLWKGAMMCNYHDFDRLICNRLKGRSLACWQIGSGSSLWKTYWLSWGRKWQLHITASLFNLLRVPSSNWMCHNKTCNRRKGHVYLYISDMWVNVSNLFMSMDSYLDWVNLVSAWLPWFLHIPLIDHPCMLPLLSDTWKSNVPSVLRMMRLRVAKK